MNTTQIAAVSAFMTLSNARLWVNVTKTPPSLRMAAHTWQMKIESYRPHEFRIAYENHCQNRLQE